VHYILRLYVACALQTTVNLLAAVDGVGENDGVEVPAGHITAEGGRCMCIASCILHVHCRPQCIGLQLSMVWGKMFRPLQHTDQRAVVKTRA
jgi:hypothetical protein